LQRRHCGDCGATEASAYSRTKGLHYFVAHAGRTSATLAPDRQ